MQILTTPANLTVTTLAAPGEVLYQWYCVGSSIYSAAVHLSFVAARAAIARAAPAGDRFLRDQRSHFYHNFLTLSGQAQVKKPTKLAVDRILLTPPVNVACVRKPSCTRSAFWRAWRKRPAASCFRVLGL